MVATLVQNQVTSPARRKPIRWTDSSCSVPGTLSAETLASEEPGEGETSEEIVDLSG